MDTKTFQRQRDGLYHKQERFIETDRLLCFCQHSQLVLTCLSFLWLTADESVVKCACVLKVSRF